jgi:hypothetical protein
MTVRRPVEASAGVKADRPSPPCAELDADRLSALARVDGLPGTEGEVADNVVRLTADQLELIAEQLRQRGVEGEVEIRVSAVRRLPKQCGLPILFGDDPRDIALSLRT